MRGNRPPNRHLTARSIASSLRGWLIVTGILVLVIVAHPLPSWAANGDTAISGTRLFVRGGSSPKVEYVSSDKFGGIAKGNGTDPDTISAEFFFNQPYFTLHWAGEDAYPLLLYLIIGLGGGSSMDCGKGVNFLLTNGGRIEDYWGVDKASEPMLPMIAVPTTAGTGSEAQSFALIANPRTHMKMACGDKKAACRVAILDPELTLTMPSAVTAATGIDAISHALETAVTTRRNVMSGRFSLEAWIRLAEGFPSVIADPGDIAARQKMLYGAHLAGAAIENSMLGATHALANPLSAHYGMTHGVAVGLMLPHVIRFNHEFADEIYGELLEAAGLGCEADETAAEALATSVEQMRRDAGLPATLAECDIQDDLLDQLAAEAAEQWTGKFNPKPVTAETLKGLYQCAAPRRSCS